MGFSGLPMENLWPKFKVDPTMKNSLKDLPHDKYIVYCEKLKEWVRNITPNQLEKIVELAKTNVMYFNHVKRGHQLASRDWNNRMIKASFVITPDNPLIIDPIWL